MSKALTDRLTLNVAIAGVVLTVIVFAICGLGPAVGAAAGATVAVLNFMGLRWLVMRLIDGPKRGQSATAVLLSLKMALVMAVIFFLLARLDLHPIGFAVGFSALFIGFAMGGNQMFAAAAEES